MITIIDYGMGNLRSVEKALEKAGAKTVKVTSSRADIDRADKIVIPGVGAMAEAMRQLKRLGLITAIEKNIFKKPCLGICLGLQLLFNESQEGPGAKGLGILAGRVLRFKDWLKVPHMGWNSVKIKKRTLPILEGVPDNSYFYFCHSYFAAPDDQDIIAATTDYGKEFASIIFKENLFALQFHPEKSQGLGLKILENFIRLS